MYSQKLYIKQAEKVLDFEFRKSTHLTGVAKIPVYSQV